MELVRLTGLLYPDHAPGPAIGLSQVFALHELDTGTPLSQRDLAGRLRLDKSTVSRLVADMEHAGLLVRDRDPDNRRYYRLRITDRGRVAHADARAAFHGRHHDLLAALTTAERHALLTGLHALIRVLHEQHPTEPHP